MVLAGALNYKSWALNEPSQAVMYEAMNLSARHMVDQSYEVCLLPNVFFDERCQPAGRQYLSLLTDTINLQFNYELSTDKPLEYKYSYTIVGRVIVFDRENRERQIYNQQFVLQDEIRGLNRGAGMLVVNETYGLNFQEFNQQAIQFMVDNGLAGEAILEVDMRIDLVAKTDDERSVSRQINLGFVVPLAKQTYSVRLGRLPDQEDLLVFMGAEQDGAAMRRVILSGMSVMTAVIVIIIFYIKYKRRPKNPCERYDMKIHKEYGRIIVDLKTPLKRSDYKYAYEVEEFEDLVDKADRVMQNILYFEMPSGRTAYAVVEREHVFLYGSPHWKRSLSTKKTKKGR